MRTTLRKLLNRINQSPISTSLARFNNNPIFRFGTLALYTFNIADAIYLFPRHPRLSLALLTLYAAFSSWLLITWALDALKIKLYETLIKVVDLNENMLRIARDAYNMAKGAQDYIHNTEPSHDEAHRTTANALRSLFDTMRVLADAKHDPNPPQLIAQAQEVPQGEDDDPDPPDD